jgi:hypothetical protein
MVDRLSFVPDMNLLLSELLNFGSLVGFVSRQQIIAPSTVRPVIAVTIKHDDGHQCAQPDNGRNQDNVNRGPAVDLQHEHEARADEPDQHNLLLPNLPERWDEHLFLVRLEIAAFRWFQLSFAKIHCARDSTAHGFAATGEVR